MSKEDEDSLLKKLPNIVMDRVLKGCDYGNRQVLRKVSHTLQNYVESQPTVFKLLKILIYKNHITFRADILNSTFHRKDIQYNGFLKNSIPCTQVYRSQGVNFFKNIFPEPLCVVFFRDFKTFLKLLKHPQSYVEHLQIENCQQEESTNDFFIHLLQLLYNLGGNQLIVHSASIKVDTELKLNFALISMDPRYLRKLVVEKIENQTEAWTLDIMRNRPNLKSFHCGVLVKDLRPFLDFEDVNITVEHIGDALVALLVRFALHPERPRTFIVNYGGRSLISMQKLMDLQVYPPLHVYYWTMDPNIVIELEAFNGHPRFRYQTVAKSKLSRDVPEDSTELFLKDRPFF